MSDFTPLKRLMRHFIEKGPSGCALVISQKGKVIFPHFEGVSDLESGRPVQEDTIFQFHSNSKLVTIAAVMQLYERGAFTLNDPVEEYLPEFKDMTVISYAGNNAMGVRPARSKIQIRHLMNMTDGLAGFGPSGDVSPAHSAIRKIYVQIKNQKTYFVKEAVSTYSA
jgi:CubicO group peptidase (beta-lactamase class C family)